MIFIDTGAFVARYRPSDQYHAEAARCWRELGKTTEPLYTSQLVLFESAKLLAQLHGSSYAARTMSVWMQSPRLHVVRSTFEQDLEAAEMLRQFADQAIGPVDCLSFVLMRAMGIRKVFGFDKHFAIAGFELWPGHWRK